MTFALKISFCSLFSNVLLLKIYNKLSVEVKITWKYCLIWVNPSRLVTVSFTVLKHHQTKQHELVWLQFTVPHHSLPLRQVKAGTEIGKEHGVKDWLLWKITTYWFVPPTLLTPHFCRTQDHHPRGSPPSVSCALLHQLSIKNTHHRVVARCVWRRYFLSWWSRFPSEFSLYVNLTLDNASTLW